MMITHFLRIKSGQRVSQSYSIATTNYFHGRQRLLFAPNPKEPFSLLHLVPHESSKEFPALPLLEDTLKMKRMCQRIMESNETKRGQA